MRLQGLFASSVLVLGGCSTFALTPVTAPEGVSVQDLTADIQCELESAYFEKQEYRSVLKPLLARTQLILNVTEGASASPTITISPVVLPATLSIPLGTDATTSNGQKVTFAYDIHMQDFEKKGTVSPQNDCPANGEASYQSRFGLGLHQWVHEIAEGLSRPGSVGSVYTLVYDADFTVTRGANGGLDFKLGTVQIGVDKPSVGNTTENHLTETITVDDEATPAPRGGKTKTSDAANKRIDNITILNNPQQFIPVPVTQ